MTLSATLLVTVWYCGCMWVRYSGSLCGIVGAHIKRSHQHKPTVWSSPSEYHRSAWLSWARKNIQQMLLFYFFGAILIIADCNQDGRSPTPPLLATVHTKPHLCLMMYLSSFCSNSQADGKAGQTDRREVNFSDSPLPPNPHLTCPNCLHRPSQFVKYGSQPFANRERLSTTAPSQLMAPV